MKLADDVRLSDDVVTRTVGEEVVLLNLATGTYFGLDPVGGRFLALIEQGKSALEARDALLETYSVAPDVLDRDLEALLDQLAANSILDKGPFE